jgi:hypothetical protein
MSYSLNDKCGTCTKKDQCNDRHFIRGAIDGIHSVYPASKGHLGSGSVDLNCQQYQEVNSGAEKAPEAAQGNPTT